MEEEKEGKREGESAQERESTNHYSISAAVITLL